MPQFILDGATTREFRDLPYLAQGFIEAMFFTEIGHGVDMADWLDPENVADRESGSFDGNLPSDCGFTDLHESAIANIVKFCADFEAAAGEYLEAALGRDGYDSTRAGNDLWYTSQGHGVGFWDRKELDGDDLGRRLSGICEHREAQVWFADHVDNGNAPFVYCEISFCGKVLA